MRPGGRVDFEVRNGGTIEMNKKNSKIINALKTVGVMAGSALSYLILLIRDKGREEGEQNARSIDIQNVTRTLVNSRKNDSEILNVLCKSFEIDEASAREYIRYEKTVEKPLRVLRNLLFEEGYDAQEVENIIFKNSVAQQLNNDSTLWKLPPAKLKEKVIK